MLIQNNKPLIHRREWQVMTPAPSTAGTGAFIIKDPLGTRRTALFVSSASSQYLYGADTDSWESIASMSLGGTFGAGACGTWGVWSNTLTATAGTVYSVSLTTNINGAIIGNTIRFLSGSNIGLERKISDIRINPGGTNIIYFDAFPNAVAASDTFAISTGRYYVWNAGTMSATSFKSYDPITNTVTALSVTSAPTTFGTDGRLVATPSYVGSFCTGTTTSGSSTTLVDTTKSWTVNQWSNYQVRITGGTGIGQVRSITSNTSTTLTVATWTTTPDATSTYTIEANDDYIYLLGNNAVTLYRYSISGNTWSTITPSVARAGAPVAGMSANWVGKTGDDVWADETNCFDGRYIYSFRGGSSVTLDRYDIALNAWSTITYINQSETFGTGSCYDVDGKYIYIRKDNSHRYFAYDVVGNYIHPWSTNIQSDGVAVLGDKLFTATYTEANLDTGTASSSASTTITDSTKTWTTNALAGYLIEITGGTGIGQIRKILSNTGNAITVDRAWMTSPTTTSTYRIVSQSIPYVYSLQNTGTAFFRAMIY